MVHTDVTSVCKALQLLQEILDLLTNYYIL